MDSLHIRGAEAQGRCDKLTAGRLRRVRQDPRWTYTGSRCFFTQSFLSSPLSVLSDAALDATGNSALR